MIVPIIGVVVDVCAGGLVGGILKAAIPKTAPIAFKVAMHIGALSTGLAVGHIVSERVQKDVTDIIDACKKEKNPPAEGAVEA